MRPAQDFYHKLVMVWLMLQKQGECNPPFAEYLTCLQTSFFLDTWQPRYLIPTRYFYERMKQDWQQLKQEGGSHNEKEVLSIFIKRVRSGMQDEWEHKIKLRPHSRTTTE